MFPFGFSVQEILFLTALLTVAGGYKKQFLQYSRSGGRFVGRAVGFIRQKRDQVFTSSGQRKELDALQQQLTDAMSQMQHIRYDIRSSARMMPPQQRHQNILDPDQHAITSSGGIPFDAANPLIPGQSTPQKPSFQPSMGQADRDKQQPHSAQTHDHTVSSEFRSTAASRSTGVPFVEADPARLEDGGSSGIGPKNGTQQSTPPQEVDAGHGSRPGVRPSNTGVSPESLAKFDSMDLGDVGGQLVFIDGVPLIPVTAEAAGKYMETKGGQKTIADVMEAAVAEQAVARKASSLFKPSGGDEEASKP